MSELVTSVSESKTPEEIKQKWDQFILTLQPEIVRSRQEYLEKLHLGPDVNHTNPQLKRQARICAAFAITTLKSACINLFINQ